MNNNLDIAIIKNQKLEEFIRDWTKNYNSPITKRDVHNLKPIIKMVNKGHYKFSSEPINERYNELVSKIRNIILDNSDIEHLLPLYTKIVDCNWKYRQIFGLCLILGLSDIFDIGCGDQCQVGYITPYKGITYTGIDYNINTDLYNEIYKKYNPYIHFIKAKYPCDLITSNNSIAIYVGCFSKDSKKVAQALSENFERVYVQVHGDELELWESIFAAYKISIIDTYSINNYFTGRELDKYVFLLITKFVDDIEYLKEINYDAHNDKFHIGSWYFQDYLGRFKNNIRGKV